MNVEKHWRGVSHRATGVSIRSLREAATWLADSEDSPRRLPRVKVRKRRTPRGCRQ